MSPERLSKGEAQERLKRCIDGIKGGLGDIIYLAEEAYRLGKKYKLSTDDVDGALEEGVPKLFDRGLTQIESGSIYLETEVRELAEMYPTQLAKKYNSPGSKLEEALKEGLSENLTKIGHGFIHLSDSTKELAQRFMPNTEIEKIIEEGARVRFNQCLDLIEYLESEARALAQEYGLPIDEVDKALEKSKKGKLTLSV